MQHAEFSRMPYIISFYIWRAMSL